MKQISESELILNNDGSVYHLNLLPDDISDTIINVGDPDRVAMVSSFFDKILIKKQKREFVTHTGIYRGQKITVLSTGIGTDNIDIVYNELDALVNIDLINRTIKPEHTSLNLIRIGTSGSLQADIPVDAFVCSEFGLGLDGLMNFYNYKHGLTEQDLLNAFIAHYPNHGIYAESYFAPSSHKLFTMFSGSMHNGITASCPGFYGPQGRALRLTPSRPDMIEKLSSFKYKSHRITNFEMETGAMYGLAHMLGHHCCSTNVIVANRISREYSKDAYKSVHNLIGTVLDLLTQK